VIPTFDLVATHCFKEQFSSTTEGRQNQMVSSLAADNMGRNAEGMGSSALEA